MEKELEEYLKIGNYEIVKDDGRLLFKKNNNFILSITGKFSTTLLPRLIPLLNGRNSTRYILNSTKEFNKDLVLSSLRMLKKYKIVETDTHPSGILFSKEENDAFKHQLKFFSYKQDEDRYKYQIKLRKARINLVVTENFLLPLLWNFTNSGIGEMTIFCREESSFSSLNNFYNRINSQLTKVKKNTYNRLTKEKIFRNRPDILIIADENISSKELSLINNWSIQYEIPWISFSDIGELEIIMGPLIVPFKTPCYKCFELRKESNLDLFKEIRLFNKTDETLLYKKNKKGFLSPFIEIISGIIALDVIKFLSGFTSPITLGKIYTVNWLTMETELHPILKLPRCPVCGLKEQAPVSFWQEPIKE